jgi:3-oxoacyl-(acyl-carrier-protein) synthase
MRDYRDTSLHHRAVPLTLNFDSPALGCDLDYVRGSSRPVKVRVALNLSCGFGGRNSCLALGSM